VRSAIVRRSIDISALLESAVASDAPACRPRIDGIDHHAPVEDPGGLVRQ